MALPSLFYDFRSPNLFLPTKNSWGRNCTCKFEKKDGVFVDDLQALVQIEYNHELFTLTIENTGGFLSNTTAFYRFYVDTFNDFECSIFDSLPVQIKRRYPYLSLVANPVRMYNGTLTYDINPSTNFSFSSCHHAGEKAIFGMADWLPIVGNELSLEQIKGIEEAIDFILKAEIDYKKYKSSRIHAVLQQKIRANRESNAISILALFKLAKLAFSVYNGFSLSDNAVSLDTLDMPNIETDSMVDYLCDDYNSVDNNDYSYSSNNPEISFTGNGDKYTDNEYNQTQADKWLDKEQECLAKGDKTGASAAHSTAMNHLKRIKS